MKRKALRAVRRVRKSDPSDDIDRILEDVSVSSTSLLYAELEPYLVKAAKAGVTAADEQVTAAINRAGLHLDLELANAYAIEFAKNRAAEMVGMKWVEGELVENPNPFWQILDSTREMLRSTIADAMRTGISNDKLADQIAAAYAFSDERAETIARTETRIADVQGNLELYKASGLVNEKEWVAFAECCDECQDLDGVQVALEDEFPNDGGDGPPLHPNCRCTFLPVIIDNED